jgi:hypothetical protein
VEGRSDELEATGTAAVAPTSGWSSAGSTLTSGSVGFRAYTVPAGQTLRVDNVVVPTAPYGAEDRY